MAQRVCIIGAGVVGLATAYALVREGFDVILVEARERGGLETSYANGGQLSYRYVAPLADSGVPAQALGWLLRNDAPLRLRPRLDPAQWRWLLGFLAACRGSLNRRNAAHLLRLALLSQRTQAWREEDGLDGFDWRRNGKLVAFRQPASAGSPGPGRSLGAIRPVRRRVPRVGAGPVRRALRRRHPHAGRGGRRLPCLLRATCRAPAGFRTLPATAWPQGDEDRRGRRGGAWRRGRRRSHRGRSCGAGRRLPQRRIDAAGPAPAAIPAQGL